MQNPVHERPPEYLRKIYKQYQNIPLSNLDIDESVTDFDREPSENKTQNITACESFQRSTTSRAAIHAYLGSGHEKCSALPTSLSDDDHPIECQETLRRYSVQDIPGLEVIPGIVPLSLQREIMSRTFHRDLSNPNHKTNIHLHYSVAYPLHGESFFALPKESGNIVEPIDPSVHKPFSMQQFLDKKLRWITLGGQYDWTEKVYPEEKPPDFPKDLSQLLRATFPKTRPEAAIVNLYSPGDTLSLHRDLSEESDRGLISLSIGCDGIFMIGLQDEQDIERYNYAIIRLRSGDAVYMQGSSRFAWHGVPKIIPGTCPRDLQDWPGTHFSTPAETAFSHWTGWMSSKRINLNVRQMFLDEEGTT